MRWTEYQTEQLLIEFNAERARADSKNRQHVAWKRICRNLRKKNIDRPTQMLKSKFNYMCKVYHKQRSLASSQAPRNNDPFFELYNETFEKYLYGNK
jgi:Myb/SANT-like DNA-binding domain